MSSSKRLSKAATGKTPRGAGPPRQEPSIAGPEPGPGVPSDPAGPPSYPARPSLRRPSSPLSRLTIKAGPPQGPRPPLELSPKPRPAGPCRLSQVDLDEDEVLVDGFEATLDGRTVRVTAVLERTCVYIDSQGERRLARKDDLWVEANRLPIRRRGIG